MNRRPHGQWPWKWIDRFVLGPCVRRLPSLDDTPPTLYLTFDDGPHADCTPAVGDILNAHGAKATFFVIGERARKQRTLLNRLVRDGHGVGNHSLDHGYSHFFQTRSRTRDWIARSQQLLSECLGSAPVGFRSPAGIRTPPLHWALKELDVPLIHWSVRFFDTSRGWAEDVAQKASERAIPGDIILLHDTHVGARKDEFLRSLDVYLTLTRRRGFRFAALDEPLVRRAMQEF